MIATATTAKKTVASYCDTCYRKGLPEKEYTSHYTKSEPGPRGVVVCPTILNAVCRACGGKGHWASEKFCPVMRREAKEGRRYKAREAQGQQQQREHSVVVKKNENRFAALLDDEGAAEVALEVPNKPTWADMAKKPAVLVVPKEEHHSALTTLSFQTVYYDPKEQWTPLMTDAEREAYKILQERKAAGCFDQERRHTWLDSEDEDECDECDEDEEW